MRTTPVARLGRRRLQCVVLGSIGMALRDLQLAAQGGGVTPRRMLRVETTLFAACALAGIAALGDGNRRTIAARLTVPIGLLGAAVHVTRLAVYLTRRGSSDR